MRPFIIVRILFFVLGIPAGVLAFRGVLSWWAFTGIIIVYAVLMIDGAMHIRRNFFLRSLCHGSGESKQLALSFDDGPALCTARIMDILKAEEVYAAFFTIGSRAAAAPELVRRLHDEGHLIGTHSYYHGFHFDWQRTRAMQVEIEKSIQVVAQITGRRPRLFRPPYGVTTPSLARALQRTGVLSVGWSLRSYDTTAKSGEALLERLLSKIKNGEIVLLHDSMEVTASILTAFIRSCREKGFTFVRLDEMLGVDAYA